MKTLQSRLPPTMKGLAKLNHHYFVVITKAFDMIWIRILNPFHKRDLAEATHAHVTQRAAFKRDSLLPFSHTFGLNATFCQCIVASSTV